MRIYIDQSGKIEDTAKILLRILTEHKNLFSSLKTKRKLQEAFRLCGFSKFFIYYTFAVGIYYLIVDFKQNNQ